MKKSGKYLVIIILIILLILVIASSIYFAITLNNKENQIKTIQSDLEQIKNEIAQNNSEIGSNENEEINIDVDKLNEELSKKVLKIKGAGSSNDIYIRVMGLEKFSEDKLSKIKQNGLNYFITDTNYSDYEEKLLEIFTKEGINNFFSNLKFVGNSNIININGKAAVSEYGWSGINYIYKSQKLISNENNVYVYEVKYNRPVNLDSNEYIELSAKVTGILKDGKYRIEKFEEQ